MNGSFHDSQNGRIWQNTLKDNGNIIEHVYFGDRDLLIKEKDIDFRKELILVFDRSNGNFVFIGVFQEFDATINSKVICKVYSNELEVVDSCCGIGINVIEGLNMGINIKGYDLNPNVVEKV